MLLNSLIKETLGIKDHVVKKVVWVGNEIEIHLDRHSCRKLPCSVCRSRSRVRDRLKERSWKHVPMWGIAVTLVYKPARVSCSKCDKIKVEDIPWSQGKSRVSKGLIWLLSVWCKELPWDKVAKLFGLHWNTVATSVHQAVSYGLRYRRLGKVLYIGIDELSRRKGHVYVTNVYDLHKGRLLWTGEGREKNTLRQFFKQYSKQLKNIKGICCDMWQSYIDVIKEYLPDVPLVFDKFHIVKHLHDAVDTIRRQEAERLKESNPELLKGTRYIWLKNPENLTDRQRTRLSYLDKLNLRSNRGRLLKDMFSDFWTYKTKGWALRFLNKWFWWATHSRLTPMRDFAWMVRNHQEQILNYFDIPITNGKVEGMNNKARVITRRCYGFRTFKHISNALYLCLGDLPRPKLAHDFMGSSLW